MTTEAPTRRQAVSEWLLLALIGSLPLMKPAVAYPIVVTDILFLILAAAVAVELLLGRRRLQWKPAYTVLAIYAAGFAISLLATPDLRTSLIKLASEFYLVGLAGVTALIVEDQQRLRRAILAWLLATAVVAAVAILGLASFVTGLGAAVLDYSSYGFGSLPPGHYPRLSMTFFNANMACDYLTVSLGILLGARTVGWIERVPFAVLLTGIAIAALATLSPGLGGIALLIGAWLWLRQRSATPRLAAAALAAGVVAGVVFVAATAVTPVLHSTAPFLIHLPGGITLAPSGRYLTWTAGIREFLRHPLIGHGIGIGAVDVHYANPSGYLEGLTDAHNMFLNVAAQAGLVGLVLIALVLSLALRLIRPSRNVLAPLSLALGLSFLDAFAYQGLGGSFEDARYLWVTLGLLIAAASITRAGGNNHRPAEPSPC